MRPRKIDTLFDPPKPTPAVVLEVALRRHGWSRLDGRISGWRAFRHKDHSVLAFVTKEGKLFFGKTLKTALRATREVRSDWLAKGQTRVLTLGDLKGD